MAAGLTERRNGLLKQQLRQETHSLSLWNPRLTQALQAINEHPCSSCPSAYTMLTMATGQHSPSSIANHRRIIAHSRSGQLPFPFPQDLPPEEQIIRWLWGK